MKEPLGDAFGYFAEADYYDEIGKEWAASCAAPCCVHDHQSDGELLKCILMTVLNENLETRWPVTVKIRYDDEHAMIWLCSKIGDHLLGFWRRGFLEECDETIIKRTS